MFGNSFPLVPGHEGVGEVVAIPEGEKKWKVGDRVGGAWVSLSLPGTLSLAKMSMLTVIARWT